MQCDSINSAAGAELMRPLQHSYEAFDGWCASEVALYSSGLNAKKFILELVALLVYWTLQKKQCLRSLSSFSFVGVSHARGLSKIQL